MRLILIYRNVKINGVIIEAKLKTMDVSKIGLLCRAGCSPTPEGDGHRERELSDRFSITEMNIDELFRYFARVKQRHGPDKKQKYPTRDKAT